MSYFTYLAVKNASSQPWLWIEIGYVVWQSHRLRNAFFGNSKQLQRHDSVHLSSVHTNYSFLVNYLYAVMHVCHASYAWQRNMYVLKVGFSWIIPANLNGSGQNLIKKRQSMSFLKLNRKILKISLKGVILPQNCHFGVAFTGRCVTDLQVRGYVKDYIFKTDYISKNNLKEQVYQVTIFFITTAQLYRQYLSTVFQCGTTSWLRHKLNRSRTIRREPSISS